MARFTQQQINEQLQKLPRVLKDAVFSTDLADKVFGLREKFALTIEEVGFIAEEIGYIILGLTRPQDLILKIQSRLNVETEEAESVAKEINNQIFYPLREALKAAHSIEIKEMETAEAPVLEKTPPPLLSQIFPPKETSAPAPREKIWGGKPPAPKIPLDAKAPASQETLASRPIDLRPQPKSQSPPASKPESLREPIFAPAHAEEKSQTLITPLPPVKPPAETQTKEQPKPPEEKKTPYGGSDPYKEPIE